ncbi:MAG: hypothetical protein KGJ90_05835 [Patescibacteria group bacterium]|nr:hypothetical protein [Patescibacteria group bacterium]
MTASPGFLKTLKTVVGKKLRGIRDSMPQGYLLGRSSSGNGPPELISMDSLLAGIKSTIGGIAANPTATASDVAVNGTATTFMRSDAAPAVQKTSSTQFGLAKVDGTSITAAGGVISTVNNGTVTSVGLTMPAEFSVTGSPVTTTGTLAVSKANQNANSVYAGPASGAAAAPAFRVLAATDIPPLPYDASGAAASAQTAAITEARKLDWIGI